MKTSTIQAPRSVSLEQAQAEGTSATSLRRVAKWNVKTAGREKSAARERMLNQADQLQATAKRLEAANDNRRRA